MSRRPTSTPTSLLSKISVRKVLLVLIILQAILLLLEARRTSSSWRLHSSSKRKKYPVIPPPGASDEDRKLMYSSSSLLKSLPSFLTTETLPWAYMHMENTVHYDLNTPLGVLEWNNASLPGPGHDGTFWLSVDSDTDNAHKQPFTLSMFHQIRCLNIIRHSLITLHSSQSPDLSRNSDRLTSHCMNYLRQMVLCRADLTLESGRDPNGRHTVVSDITHVCRDWSMVWNWVEVN